MSLLRLQQSATAEKLTSTTTNSTTTVVATTTTITTMSSINQLQSTAAAATTEGSVSTSAVNLTANARVTKLSKYTAFKEVAFF